MKTSCLFYLGTHMPQWLGRVSVPLFVSRRTLSPRKTMPRALGRWSLDSGGFTELQMYGRWTVSADTYAGEVRRISDEVGRLDWAAPQDWMCEPIVISGGVANGVKFAGTGLSVRTHQRKTVDNYIELMGIAPDLPWIPVLQGWERDDYLRCWEMYERSGVTLERLPTVGVGTVCRRQGTDDAVSILTALRGLNLHGFGFKVRGIEKAGHLLSSADSMAWSYGARRSPVMCGSTTHKNCANCIVYALEWRERVISGVPMVEMDHRRPRRAPRRQASLFPWREVQRGE